ncbi:uncharacterized protein LACBIDRAFT_313392 [Laccaria bicolor S238N-H82]|uniref:Predicted protein n=1 Tax=Laccaria bicolor (strain S238N-H82 / ATCC MYA-4686) TaxID=486041 RepID=B0DY79_LACBS|nr:uncharacterized protein LACBIDRAFT_313392 [Laccaria bicolor S238N-H82]EDR00512.1 predicted protein [Laccaria bicolor S238N-H82]|eukprot:XP_001888904.1 predicted protein [Laccaria bicolor S238N-H82]
MPYIVWTGLLLVAIQPSKKVPFCVLPQPSLLTILMAFGNKNLPSLLKLSNFLFTHSNHLLPLKIFKMPSRSWMKKAQKLQLQL